MLYLLRIAAIAGLLACILQADVTYQYSGANFDTECSTFVGCVPVSGVAGLTGYATFSQPLGSNQTVDSNSPLLLDWQLDGPFGYVGDNAGNSTLLLTTGANRQITSWNLYGSNPPPCGGDFCETDQTQSSSTGGDYTVSGIEIDQFYYASYSASTPGTWTPEFVLTPEPAATPLAKLLVLLATIAGVAMVRKRNRSGSTGPV